jgi:hypothetical protein
MLTWDEAQPGRHLPTSLKIMAIAQRRYKRSRAQGPNPLHLLQPLTRFHLVPDLVEPYPDNDPEGAPEPPPVPVAPLPEAPASCNVRVTIGGRECQITLRDTDEARLLARLKTLLQQYPLPQLPQAARQEGKEWCHVHKVAMTLNEKQGRRWYSHRTEDGFCKGR